MMARWDDWDYGEPENRKRFVDREMKKLNHPPAHVADPEIEREKTAKRLAEHDALFLDMSPEAVARRLGYVVLRQGKVSAGDPDGAD